MEVKLHNVSILLSFFLNTIILIYVLGCTMFTLFVSYLICIFVCNMVIKCTEWV